MSQNITLLGASYSDVPSVELPKTGGGTASFTDVTDTTATASDVALGKYFYLANGVKTLGTGSGGVGGVTQDQDGYIVLDDDAPSGSITVESLSVTSNGTYTAPSGKAYSPVSVNVSGGTTADSDAVQFIDYDGTVLYEYSAEQFLALTAMPANPSHTGLVAQGWNWTLADAQEVVEEWGYLVIGQMYTTASGATEIDITLHKGRLSPWLSLGVNGTVEIDWGDNSSTDTVTGTHHDTVQRTNHTYSAEGNYTIKITLISGTSYSLASTSTYTLLSANNSTANYNYVYSGAVNAIRLGDNVLKIGNYALYYCTRLQTITIPNTCYTGESYTFSGNYSLLSVTYPIGKVSCAPFSNAYCLKNASFPKDISYGQNLVGTCLSLKTVTLFKTGVSTYIGSGSLMSLTRIIVSAQNYKYIKNYRYDATPLVDGKTTLSNYLLSGIQQPFSLNLPSGVAIIGLSTFAYSYLESITIPNTVTTINANAFDSTRLKSVVIPSLQTAQLLCNLTSLPNGTFNGNYSLRSVNIPSTVTTIGQNAFSSCHNLTNITLPSGVTSIGSSAFSSCRCLSSITIPASVTSIGNSAFSYCYGLGEIHLKPTTPPTIQATSVFNNLPTDCIIYVPSGKLNDYQTAQYWSTWASQMQEEAV